jgi:hypothetical protein
MASSKAGSSAKLPAISFHQRRCFPLAVPNSALSLATSASRAATLCSRLTAVTGIPLLNCELFLILSIRIPGVNSATKVMQHRLATSLGSIGSSGIDDEVSILAWLGFE